MKIESLRSVVAVSLILFSFPAAPRGAAVTIDECGAFTIVDGSDTLTRPNAGKCIHRAPNVYSMKFDVAEGEAEPGYTWKVRGTERYDPEQKKVLSEHNWGHYAITYSVSDERLSMAIEIANTTDTLISKVALYLSDEFTWPKTPYGYAWQKGWMIFSRSDAPEPPVVVADYGSGAVVAAVDGAPSRVLTGFLHSKRAYFEYYSIEPHDTVTATVSLRFGKGRDAGGDPYTLAQDVFDDFAQRYPHQLPQWPDRRPIAALHPSSSHKGAHTVGETTNPRGWIFNNYDLDVTTAEGRSDFREHAMEFAHRSVAICTSMNAQGVIVWSLEGQEFKHSISYIGSPDKLPRLAPEMDEIADAWFKIFSDAGLKTGICLRPQELDIPEGFDPYQTPPGHVPRQENLWNPDLTMDTDAILALLTAKLDYALRRWGCTIYYIDTNVGSRYEKDSTGKWKPVFWRVHPWTIYAELARRFPQCLILPEHESFAYWSHTAPIGATPANVTATWPEAFSVNLMQNFHGQVDNPAAIRGLGNLVARGDILLFPGWYNAKGNAVVQKIYEDNHVARWHDPLHITRTRSVPPAQDQRGPQPAINHLFTLTGRRIPVLTRDLITRRNRTARGMFIVDGDRVINMSDIPRQKTQQRKRR